MSESEPQSGEEREKTSDCIGLASHFPAEDRVRTWPPGADWLTFLKTQINLIGSLNWIYRGDGEDISHRSS